MKKLIVKIFLLLLPVFVLGVSMEYMLRRIPNDYVYKNNYLDKHSEEIQILILGSSQSYYGINPDYFPQNTFNACHVSQSLDLDYKILSKYKNNFSNLKVIILPIPYPVLWEKLGSSVESWRMKNYALYYGIDTESLMDNSEVLNGKLGINIQRIYNCYFKKNNGIPSQTLGWGTSYRSENNGNLEESGKNRSLGHTYDIHSKENVKIYKGNLEALDSFAEFCNRKNVELILVTIPTYYTYRKNQNEEQLNKMFDTMNDFVAKHNNCQYLNWYDDPDFVAKDYHDADHLCENGAIKLSEKLVKHIDSLGIFE